MTLRFLSIITFSFIASVSFSFSALKSGSAYEHLYEVNKEWKHHRSIAPNELVTFQDDIDRISYHINLVEHELRNNIPNGITGESLANRLKLLTELDQYGDQKIFPTNLYHSERTPYFIDDFGVHCAVGYLIMKSGRAELSNRISAEHNFDYISDIKTPGIEEWAKEFGFELHELAWIQPGYSSTTTYSSVGNNGVNGKVRVMCEDYTNNRLIYAGEFTEIDGGTSCSGIGYYEAGTMNCLGGGLDGIINHVYEAQGSIYVSGLLTNGGTDYAQAIFSNGVWTYVNIPGLEGKEARTGMNGASDYKREIVIMNDQGSNEHEVWRLNNADVWEKQATAFGEINSMALSDTHHAYGGAFSSLTLHLSSGDQSLSSINACLRENSSENWLALTGQIADTVLVVKWLNSNFFFGGIDDVNPNGVVEPCAPIAMLHSDTLAGLFGGINGGTSGSGVTVKIRDIDVVSDQRIVVCGEFQSNDGMNFGDNVCIVDYSDFASWVGTGWGTITTEPLGSWGWDPKPINGAVIVGQTLYVGGDFESAPMGTDTGPMGGTTIIYSEANHLAQLNMPLSVASNELPDFKVFPNPTGGQLMIQSDSKCEEISILDMNGRPVMEKMNLFETIDVGFLSSGTYLVKFTSESGRVSHQRIVVN